MLIHRATSTVASVSAQNGMKTIVTTDQFSVEQPLLLPHMDSVSDWGMKCKWNGNSGLHWFRIGFTASPMTHTNCQLVLKHVKYILKVFSVTGGRIPLWSNQVFTGLQWKQKPPFLPFSSQHLLLPLAFPKTDETDRQQCTLYTPLLFLAHGSCQILWGRSGGAGVIEGRGAERRKVLKFVLCLLDPIRV